MKKSIGIFILLLPTIILSQFKYTGKVVDSLSKSPLPFVNIRINNTQKGFATDIDGLFEYESQVEIEEFEFNYLGYVKKTVNLKYNSYNDVVLKSKSIGLEEVVIDASYNPALRIIRNVITNRKSNNPEKNLNYSFDCYNKLTLRAEYDSVKASGQDSSLIKMQQFFSKQDLMLVESIVETYHKAPNQTQDIIKASRTSGIKNTVLPLLATEIQSFSFYNTFFTLSDIQYVSPISAEGFGKYSYELIEEYIEDADTIFVVSFSPNKNKSFDAMKGVLYISSFKYGVKNVIAKPVSIEGMAEIQINQKYQVIDSVWFPEQLNSNLQFNNMTLDGLKIIGETTSYLKEVNLNPTEESLKFHNISLNIDVKEQKENEVILENGRYSDLSARDSLTYKVIDSIGDKAKLDKKMSALDSYLEGRIPIGKIDLDFEKSFGYNKYEGVRLGAGLYTNSRLMKKVKLGGYFSYGFKDQAWKYGGDLDVNIIPKKGLGFNFSYTNDISQAGEIIIGENKTFVNNDNLYSFYTSLYDRDINFEASLRFRIKGVKASVLGKVQDLTPLYDYYYNEMSGQNVTFQPSSFYNSFIGVTATYSPFSRVMFDGTRLVDLASKYPIINLSYLQTVPVVGAQDIKRVLVKISDEFTLPYIGKTSYSLITGRVSKDAPFPYLFNLHGTKDDFNVSVFESFETMNTNEFYSSSFISGFFEQNFGSIAKKGFFQPELCLYQGVGFGEKVNPDLHQYLQGRDMKKGYLESGLKIYNIIHSGTSGFGLGVFYRYGQYSLPTLKDNFAYKITLSVGF